MSLPWVEVGTFRLKRVKRCLGPRQTSTSPVSPARCELVGGRFVKAQVVCSESLTRGVGALRCLFKYGSEDLRISGGEMC